MIRRALDLTAYIFRWNFPKTRCALQSWGTRLDICMDVDLKTRDKCQLPTVSRNDSEVTLQTSCEKIERDTITRSAQLYKPAFCFCSSLHSPIQVDSAAQMKTYESLICDSGHLSKKLQHVSQFGISLHISPYVNEILAYRF